MTRSVDKTWIWHPNWVEKPASSSAGAFVHFRKSVSLEQVPASPVNISITADTRYRLYINSCFVHAGPVKGDQHAWFYDTLDIQPYLRRGQNWIVVHVLRFYHASHFAASFPRSTHPGLYVTHDHHGAEPAFTIQTDDTWETAIDPCRLLPNASSNFDYFLHNFENVDQRESHKLEWTAAKPYVFMVSHGLAMPWNLHPRMIPPARLSPTHLAAIHNIRSPLARETWESLLRNRDGQGDSGILLQRGTAHHVELAVDHHTTAYVAFRFSRPETGGSTLTVTWSEGYEHEPVKLPFDRKKGDRADTTKFIVGPKDRYIFGGPQPEHALLGHHEAEREEEVFSPFAFRTFRYFALDIQVSEDSDLALKSIDIVKTNYDLQVSAAFRHVDSAGEDPWWFHKLWEVSLRTLTNCMHDCYEDCPFFEQLQYAMDTRSSALFTYFISRDDRLARQAIMQLYNSFQPSIGLTAGRAPSHHLQIITHFSLFWVCMITDHYEHFADADFVSRFLPVVYAVLDTFSRRIDPETGLIRVSQAAGEWEFVDWTEAYQPMGTPPARSTGYMTYTNELYAYTLQRLALLLSCLGKETCAEECTRRADAVVQGIREHCFDGVYFTDGLAKYAKPDHYSEHSQIWAVLCGVVRGEDARKLLSQSLSESSSRQLTRVSIAMAFYSLRALSVAGDSIYETHFHSFWEPWRGQLALNMTTWVEDYITQRSDCHAWGSLPLYEFTGEVAGLRPVMENGGRVLVFKPRIRLFKSFEAELPVGRTVGSLVVARVKWHRDRERSVTVSLSWEGSGKGDGKSDFPLLRVILPGRQEEMITTYADNEWVVNVTDI